MCRLARDSPFPDLHNKFAATLLSHWFDQQLALLKDQTLSRLKSAGAIYGTAITEDHNSGATGTVGAQPQSNGPKAGAKGSRDARAYYLRHADNAAKHR